MCVCVCVCVCVNLHLCSEVLVDAKKKPQQCLTVRAEGFLSRPADPSGGHLGWAGNEETVSSLRRVEE